MNHAAYTLLWFRPLSPLQYALPPPIEQLPWVSTLHIPIDTLLPISVSTENELRLHSSNTWLLSSPTAAYLAAKKGAPETIAVMGLPTQSAWRQAGGAEPKQWLVSPTGESMGLLDDLLKHPIICMLRGKHGRNDLIEALRSENITVLTVPMYEKTQHAHFVSELNKAINTKPVALYLSSTDQASRILANTQNKSTLLASPIWVSHERIATAAQALGFTRIQQYDL